MIFVLNIKLVLLVFSSNGLRSIMVIRYLNLITKGDRIMTKGRKTTYEERIEIVSFCIANNDDYHLTAR